MEVFGAFVGALSITLIVGGMCSALLFLDLFMRWLWPINICLFNIIDCTCDLEIILNVPLVESVNLKFSFDVIVITPLMKLSFQGNFNVTFR